MDKQCLQSIQRLLKAISGKPKREQKGTKRYHNVGTLSELNVQEHDAVGDHQTLNVPSTNSRDIPWRSLSSEKLRLQTFCKYPSGAHKSAILLAKDGFVYVGTGTTSDDSVLCYFCAVNYSGWLATDNIHNVHTRLSPNCPMITLVDCHNAPIPVPQNWHYLIAKLLSQNDKSVSSESPKGSGNTEEIEFEVSIEVGLPESKRRHVIVCDSHGQYQNTEAQAPDRFPGPTQTASTSWTDLVPPQSQSDVVAQSPGERIEASAVAREDPLERDVAVQAVTEMGFQKHYALYAAKDLRDEETINNLREENFLLRQRTVCKICKDKEVCFVFLPCGHLVSCAECARTTETCPVCRQDVLDCVQANYKV
ncbi:baculoviral IAP repeat-containing protein 2 isoform X2 [Aplysia californica]|uniref:Baculoviral IAP repeat-containing protein 2 isoform X2 n=1 Tax=Aplysia californica TaxID=6500 RepID=A0ABM1VRD7_APLCA|nr:baculoviral IAP repeat-containing protein 2 isoform X2 [Aplysia californica]